MKKSIIFVLISCVALGVVVDSAFAQRARWEKRLEIPVYAELIGEEEKIDIGILGSVKGVWGIKQEWYNEFNARYYRSEGKEAIDYNPTILRTNYRYNLSAYDFWYAYTAVAFRPTKEVLTLGDIHSIYNETYLMYGKKISRRVTMEAGIEAPIWLSHPDPAVEGEIDPYARLVFDFNIPLGKRRARALLTERVALRDQLTELSHYKALSETRLSYTFSRYVTAELKAIFDYDSAKDVSDMYKEISLDFAFTYLTW